MTHRRIVFCDFDGTITSEETFVGMLKRFSPEPYEAVAEQVMDGRLSLRDGVLRMVEAIPTDRFRDMQAYILEQEPRPGFIEFLDFLNGLKIPFVVVSGGILEQVKTFLAPLDDRIAGMHGAKLSMDDVCLRMHSSYEGPRELVHKEKVLAEYDFDESVVIGDGMTDIGMAVIADIVFTRDHLMDYLDRAGIEFFQWSDFFDITKHLTHSWGDP